jgi:hypothetical protein
MTGPDKEEKRERTFEDVMWGRMERKRARIRAEMKRNREGGPHTVPPWLLVAVLVVLLIGWLYLLFTD